MCTAQVRTRAAALLKKYPLAKCSPEVQAAAAAAQRARQSRAGRKRFGGRYTGGFWPADGGSRTPYPPGRPSRFHDSGVLDKDLISCKLLLCDA
jgi:hypothetical protein